MENDNPTMGTFQPTRPGDRAWGKIPLASHRSFRTVGVGVVGLARVTLSCAFMAAFFCLSEQSQAGGEPPAKRGSMGKPDGLTLVRRSVSQDQGAWVIDYQLRHTGSAGLILMPS